MKIDQLNRYEPIVVLDDDLNEAPAMRQNNLNGQYVRLEDVKKMVDSTQKQPERRAGDSLPLISVMNILNETCRHGHGTRYEHITKTIKEADEIMARLSLGLPMSNDVHLALPRASYQEIDVYVARARNFLNGTTSGHPELANMAISYVAELMAYMDGKRIRAA